MIETFLVNHPFFVPFIFALYLIASKYYWLNNNHNLKTKVHTQSVQIKELNSEILWEKQQNKMIIDEVNKFRLISKDLKEKSLDLLIQFKEEEERKDLLEEIQKDLNKN